MEKKYNLENISPLAFDVITNTLNIPPSSIQDVKIVKSNRPIFRVFFENNQFMDIIENPTTTELNIRGVLYDLTDIRDQHAAEYEVDRLMQQVKPKPEDVEGDINQEPFPDTAGSGGGSPFIGGGDFGGGEVGGETEPEADEEDEDNEPIPTEV